MNMLLRVLTAVMEINAHKEVGLHLDAILAMSANIQTVEGNEDLQGEGASLVT